MYFLYLNIFLQYFCDFFYFISYIDKKGEKKMKEEKEYIHKEMKKKMKQLQKYTATLRLRSILYDESNRSLEVEDDLVDYLNYTKSIINCSSSRKTYYSGDPVLSAMEKRHKNQQERKKQDEDFYVLLLAIQQLPELERNLLFDLYVRNLDKKVIELRQGGIVESTLHRRLNRALEHLWEYLKEV
jgi:hypothetical protein